MVVAGPGAVVVAGPAVVTVVSGAGVGAGVVAAPAVVVVLVGAVVAGLVVAVVGGSSPGAGSLNGTGARRPPITYTGVPLGTSRGNQYDTYMGMRTQPWEAG